MCLCVCRWVCTGMCGAHRGQKRTFFFPRRWGYRCLLFDWCWCWNPERSVSTFSHWPLGNTVLNLHWRLGWSLVVIHCCSSSHCWGLCFCETVANGCSLTPGWFWRGHGGAFSRTEVRREGTDDCLPGIPTGTGCFGLYMSLSLSVCLLLSIICLSFWPQWSLRSLVINLILF